MSQAEPIDIERRHQPDRRGEPTTIWSILCFAQRRAGVRRATDQTRHIMVDRFTRASVYLAVLLLSLSLIDGILTILLMDEGCKELNPVMNYLLNKGPKPFVIGKYVLTAAGLPLMLVLKNYPLWGSRFKVGYLLQIFVTLYAILLCYQIYLFTA